WEPPCQLPCRYVRSHDEATTFRQLAGQADCTVVIAPEFDGLLATRCRWVHETGGRLLGPGLDAVELTADKLALSRHLRECEIPTPSYHRFRQAERYPLPFPFICKPRHGAGSQQTILVRAADELDAFLAEARREGPLGEF